MTALSANRLDSKKMVGHHNIAPVAADAVIYVGAMVAINADGYLAPATTADDIIVVGVASEAVDNTDGDNGDLTCKFERGVFLMKNSAGDDEIGLLQIGQVVFAVDDQTVAATSNSDARSAAGTLHWFDDSGPWVKLDT
jgi:hypothetical protein